MDTVSPPVIMISEDLPG